MNFQNFIKKFHKELFILIKLTSKHIFTFIHTMLKLLGGNFSYILYLFSLILLQQLFPMQCYVNSIFFISEHYFQPVLHLAISVSQGYFSLFFVSK